MTNIAVRAMRLKEGRELSELSRLTRHLLLFSTAKLTHISSSERLDDRKLRVAQAFCLFLHDSIAASRCLAETPYVSQGGAVARSGIEGCIIGAYLLISPPEIAERFLAFEGFALARNVARYLAAFPEAYPIHQGPIKEQLEQLAALKTSRMKDFDFDDNTPSGIRLSTVKQAEMLDLHARRHGLPVEWRKIHRLGLEPVQTFAHASATATLVSSANLMSLGARFQGEERGQYLQALRMAIIRYEHVMLKEVPAMTRFLRSAHRTTSTIASLNVRQSPEWYAKWYLGLPTE